MCLIISNAVYIQFVIFFLGPSLFFGSNTICHVVWTSAEAYQSKDAAPGPNPVPPPAVTHENYSDQNVPPSGETKLKGDGFWRGW